MRQFKVGDGVCFVQDGQREQTGVHAIPYGTEGNNIPRHHIQHGSTQFGKEYYKQGALIVAKYKSWFIVRFHTIADSYVQLGFQPENLVLKRPAKKRGSKPIIKLNDFVEFDTGLWTGAGWVESIDKCGSCKIKYFDKKYDIHYSWCKPVNREAV